MILIFNISLIINNPIQSFAFLLSNLSRNDTGTLIDEKDQDQKLSMGMPRTLSEYNNPLNVSSTEKIKIESIIDKTYESPDIPITNSTIILPDPAKESALKKNNTSGDFNKTSDIFSSISKTTVKSSSDTIKSEDIFRFTPSDLKKSNIISYKAEPSIATNGKIFLFTGNDFAAISKDGANSWKYFNLKEVMPDFCCDQDVIYDSKHKLFLWYMQGNYDCSGENRSLIGISRDGSIWRFIEIKPTQIDNKLTNSWFDYPQLALSNNFFYITTNINTLNVKNIKSCSTGQDDIIWIWPLKVAKENTQTYSTIIRIPLEELSKSLSNSSIPPEFDSHLEKGINNRFTFTPVQGATNTMFWATHVANEKIRIYNWTESLDSKSVKYKDVKVKYPWLPINSSKTPLSCPLDNKTISAEWCGKADSRISGGWISDEMIGFLWNAGAGKNTTHGFKTTKSYIDGALFNSTNNMEYEGRPYIWADRFDWIYSYTTPNNNGDIGVVAVFGGGEYNPSVGIGIANNISSYKNSSIFWKMLPIVCGKESPDHEVKKWGDYLRLRPYSTDSWIGTGFTLEGNKNIHPVIFKFDKSILDNYKNPDYLQECKTGKQTITKK